MRTRRSKFITYNGETLTLSEWSRKLGFDYQLVKHRLQRGWEFETAIKTSNSDPVLCKNQKILLSDWIGRKSNMLTVVGEIHQNIKGKIVRKFECLCDCGKTCYVEPRFIESGYAKSCGHTRPRHGSSRTRLFKVWWGMKMRCECENSASYANYGGRGISVCKEWQQFPAFKEWSLSHGYEKGLTIDRIDVNSNYTPDNCRWVDWKVQGNNKRTNTFLTFNGKTQTVSQWARELNINVSTIFGRMRRGKPIETILSTRNFVYGTRK